MLEKEFRRNFEAIPDGFTPYFSGLDPESYVDCLRDVIVGDCDPENAVLLEIDPDHQKTRIDFTTTEKLIGIPTVSATEVIERGGRLYYPKDGREVPIRRVYNRVIFDEVERKGLDLSHIFERDLDVTWVGHPNWYLRISKYSLPFIESRYCPPTWFVSDLEEYPEDLENYVLKPLFSFAGLGVEMGPPPSASAPCRTRELHPPEEGRLRPRGRDPRRARQGRGPDDVRLEGPPQARQQPRPHEQGEDDGRRLQQREDLGGREPRVPPRGRVSGGGSRSHPRKIF